ncbi:hypothetical protein D3C80_710950 [compost metagenome]
MAKRKAAKKKPVKVELPVPKKKRIRVTGADMGTVNYAVTQIEAWLVEGEMRFKVIGSKMMEHMIHDVKNAQFESVAFLKEYSALGKADYVAAERYQSRPGRTAGGSTVESISMMMGLMLAAHPKIPTTFYTAATWKNEFNKTAADLKEMYEDLKTKYKGQGVVIHQLDSFFIALYHAAKLLRVPPYQFIKSHTDEQRLFNVLSKAPTL